MLEYSNNYKLKYLKYKNKYLLLKKSLINGGDPNENQDKNLTNNPNQFVEDTNINIQYKYPIQIPNTNNPNNSNNSNNPNNSNNSNNPNNFVFKNKPKKKIFSKSKEKVFSESKEKVF